MRSLDRGGQRRRSPFRSFLLVLALASLFYISGLPDNNELFRSYFVSLISATRYSLCSLSLRTTPEEEVVGHRSLISRTSNSLYLPSVPRVRWILWKGLTGLAKGLSFFLRRIGKDQIKDLIKAQPSLPLFRAAFRTHLEAIIYEFLRSLPTGTLLSAVLSSE